MNKAGSNTKWLTRASRPALALVAALAGMTAASGCRDAAKPAADLAQAAKSAAQATTPDHTARWVQAIPADPRSVWDVPATVQTDALGRGEVTSPVALRLREVRLRPGDTVQAGDVVLVGEAPELVRALALRHAAAGRLPALQRLRAELAGLHRDGLGLLRDLREAETRIADAQAEQARAEAEIQASGLSAGELSAAAKTGLLAIRAPVTGVVRDVLVSPGGQWAPGGLPMAVLVAPRPVRIAAKVHQAWPVGAELVFRGWQGLELPLDPTPVAETVDPDTGSRLVWWQPLAPAAGQPAPTAPGGTAGRVQVRALPASATEVPLRALRRQGGRSEVLVKTGNRLAFVAVQVLTVTSDHAVVLGLEAGTQVAAEADHAALLLAPETTPTGGQ
jgi:biotin carboxyl carrier protein